MTQDRVPAHETNTNGSVQSRDSAESSSAVPGADSARRPGFSGRLLELWSPTGKPSIALDGLALIVTLAVAFLFLRPILRTGFINDDFNAVHVSVVGFDRANFTTADLWRQIDITFRLKATPHLTIHRPLVMLTFLWNVIRDGTDAAAFARTTLFLHLLAGAVFFSLARTFCPRAGTLAIACGTLLFLVSPLNLETASWSSARSDTLSFIFGALALIVRKRREDSYFFAIVAAVLVLLALFAKESALAFLLALGLFDLSTAWRKRSAAGGGLIGFLAEALWRALPVVIVFGLFATIRFYVFDTVFGHYTSKSGEAILKSASIGQNLMHSLAVLVAPVSDIAYPKLLIRGPAVSLHVAAVAAILVFGVVRIRRTVAFAIFLLVAVFWAALALGVLVNPASFSLVGTRALYTPFAMFLVVAIAVSTRESRRIFDVLPLATLLLLALIAVRPSIEPHIVTSQRIAEIVGSVRDAIRPLDDGKNTTVMILGYAEERFFAGSYDMAICMPKAVRTPFLRHDYDLLKVSGPAGAIGDVKEFGAALERADLDRTIVCEFEVVDSVRHAKLVWPGRRDADNGAAVRPIAPNGGVDVLVDLSDERSPPPTLVFDPGDVPAHSFALTVMTPFRSVTGLVMPASATAAAGPKPGLHAIVVPKPAIEASSPDSTSGVFAWAVTALDAEGRPIAHSGLAFFRGRVVRKNE